MRYIILFVLFLIIASCTATPEHAVQITPAHCVAHDALPDQHSTTGAVFPNVTSARVCKAGYASSVRNVSQAVKDKVYTEYGIAKHSTGEYEVDHEIPLEIGGSNDIANLWPEPYTGPYNAHEKDKVENYLHDQVCSGKMLLKDAQTEIAKNWKQFMHS